jgi:hypothetical protein
MSGVNDGLGREWEDLFPDSIQKNFPTASGQVPAANAICKKDIAAKELAVLGEIQAETTRAVARNVQELGFRPNGRRGRSFFEKMRGVDGPQFLGETEGEHGIRLEAEKGGVGMIVNGAFGPFGKVSCVPDVIPMSMGEKEGVRFEFFLF